MPVTGTHTFGTGMSVGYARGGFIKKRGRKARTGFRARAPKPQQQQPQQPDDTEAQDTAPSPQTATPIGGAPPSAAPAVAPPVSPAVPATSPDEAAAPADQSDQEDQTGYCRGGSVRKYQEGGSVDGGDQSNQNYGQFAALTGWQRPQVPGYQGGGPVTRRASQFTLTPDQFKAFLIGHGSQYDHVAHNGIEKNLHIASRAGREQQPRGYQDGGEVEGGGWWAGCEADPTNPMCKGSSGGGRDGQPPTKTQPQEQNWWGDGGWGGSWQRNQQLDDLAWQHYLRTGRYAGPRGYQWGGPVTDDSQTPDYSGAPYAQDQGDQQEPPPERSAWRRVIDWAHQMAGLTSEPEGRRLSSYAQPREDDTGLPPRTDESDQPYIPGVTSAPTPDTQERAAIAGQTGYLGRQAGLGNIDVDQTPLSERAGYGAISAPTGQTLSQAAGTNSLADLLSGKGGLPPEEMQRREQETAAANPDLSRSGVTAKMLEDIVNTGDVGLGHAMSQSLREHYDDTIAKAQGAAHHDDVVGSAHLTNAAMELLPDGKETKFTPQPDGNVGVTVSDARQSIVPKGAQPAQPIDVGYGLGLDQKEQGRIYAPDTTRGSREVPAAAMNPAAAQGAFRQSLIPERNGYYSDFNGNRYFESPTGEMVKIRTPQQTATELLAARQQGVGDIPSTDASREPPPPPQYGPQDPTTAPGYRATAPTGPGTIQTRTPSGVPLGIPLVRDQAGQVVGARTTEGAPAQRVLTDSERIAAERAAPSPTYMPAAGEGGAWFNSATGKGWTQEDQDRYNARIGGRPIPSQQAQPQFTREEMESGIAQREQGAGQPSPYGQTYAYPNYQPTPKGGVGAGFVQRMPGANAEAYELLGPGGERAPTGDIRSPRQKALDDYKNQLRATTGTTRPLSQVPANLTEQQSADLEMRMAKQGYSADEYRAALRQTGVPTQTNIPYQPAHIGYGAQTPAERQTDIQAATRAPGQPGYRAPGDYAYNPQTGQSDLPITNRPAYAQGAADLASRRQAAAEAETERNTPPSYRMGIQPRPQPPPMVNVPDSQFSYDSKGKPTQTNKGEQDAAIKENQQRNAMHEKALSDWQAGQRARGQADTQWQIARDRGVSGGGRGTGTASETAFLNSYNQAVKAQQEAMNKGLEKPEQYGPTPEMTEIRNRIIRSQIDRMGGTQQGPAGIPGVAGAGAAGPASAGEAPGAPRTAGSPGGMIPAQAAAALRANPQLRAQFDAKYGPNASSLVLGQ